LKVPQTSDPQLAQNGILNPLVAKSRIQLLVSDYGKFYHISYKSHPTAKERTRSKGAGS